jgi:alkylation response protein AidB-like acyl-CoA dehydrogenase
MSAAAPSPNFFTRDTTLRAWLARHLPDELARREADLAEFGAFVGGPLDAQAAFTDSAAPPRLEPYDREGRLVNRIVHNPLWDETTRETYGHGVIGLNYGADPAPYALTFAMGYLLAQADISTHCPVTMTGAVAYVVDRFAPASVRARWLPELVRRDGRQLTGGTWATEQHGGSDVGATTTTVRATPEGVRLNGLKWFTSNANGGLALATARPEGAPAGSKGLGVYLVPTTLPDGAPNPMRIRRLKDKLGTKGVPTGEIDLVDTWAEEVAPPPRGFRLMMEALTFSRIHNAVGSVGIQRRAIDEALAFADARAAFGHVIARYPMVQEALVEMIVAYEAGFGLAFEAALAQDAAAPLDVEDAEAPERVWLRLATALAKYRTAEDATAATRGALELIGGNGYTADFVTPRLLRDAQVLTVWEGPANIQALELLRLIGNRGAALDMLARRVRTIGAALPEGLGALAARLDAALDEAHAAVALVRSLQAEAQRHARRLLGLLADLLGAALLAERAAADWADGDGRAALVARLHVERAFDPPARRGILPGRDAVERHFDALARNLAIPTADLARDPWFVAGPGRAL